MKQLIIPSRHIIYSKEQYEALKTHLAEHQYEKLIFVVTSSNLNNCKYSPIALSYRIMMIMSLVFELKKQFSFSYSIVCLPHYNQIENFVDKIIKTITFEYHQDVSKETTEVFCFGAYIGKLFEDSGYVTYTKTAVDHIVLFRELFEKENTTFFYDAISDPSKEVLSNQEEILVHAKNIWRDKILKEMGSITDTRNYMTYAAEMSNKDMIEVKYKDIKEYVVEGKISDEGCADAMLFVPIARDFPDSDLIGVDISNDFIARANENIRRGLFGDSFVSIKQMNLIDTLFDDGTINTTICNSTLHEIWSYNKKRTSVDEYLALKYKQLTPGGRVLIRDVIGPEDKNKKVLLRSLEDENNKHFLKFIRDFKHVRDEDTVEEVSHNGVLYHKTTLKLAGEYLLHKDYTNNWDSEVQEEFCHFSVNDWREVLLAQNFKITAIESYGSEWIYTNRYNGKVELLDEEMRPLPFPHTNVVIVAEK
jgi:hypothetical protein